MRKPGYLIMVSFTAALTAVSISMVSYASGGWQKEKVNDGEVVWVYLDEEGRRMADTLIQYENDTYYLDSNGIMVTNQWVLYPPPSPDSGTPEHENAGAGDADSIPASWYYFNSSGKACRGARKSIDGHSYVFNDDSAMMANQLLHLDGDKYYVDEDGVLAVNRWVSFLNGPGHEDPCEDPVTTVWYPISSSLKLNFLKLIWTHFIRCFYY